MRDKRPVDELSVEELERVLTLKKREARVQRYRGGSKHREQVSAPLPVPAQPQAVVPQQPITPTATPTTPQPIPQHPTEISYDDGGVPQFEDDLVDREYRPVIGYDAAAPENGLWKRIASNFFFVLEFAAILGLVGLIYLAYQGLTQVNTNIEKTNNLTATSEAELAQQRIIPSPTPLITVQQVVLPGGHVWDENGQHSFNLDEVPAPYRPIFQEQLNAPRANNTFEIPEGAPIRIEIPRLNVDAGIRAGDDWISLQAGVGHQQYSSNPGVEGNMVLTAHNDIYGEIFRRLDELQPGDEVRIQSSNGEWYTYLVRESQIVDPTEVWVLDQNLGQETPITTLISCYPYRVNTHRVVVFAELLTGS